MLPRSGEAPRARCVESGRITVTGMGLVSAWVLITLTGLAALGFAAAAWRATRSDHRPERTR